MSFVLVIFWFCTEYQAKTDSITVFHPIALCPRQPNPNLNLNPSPWSITYDRRLYKEMFRVTQVACAAWKKSSTGIVGVPFDPHARETLISLQKETIEKAKALLPEESEYFKSVMATAKHRLRACETITDDLELEEELVYGQLEELAVAAKDELNLIQFYHDEDVYGVLKKFQERTDEEKAKDPWEMQSPGA